MAAVKIAIITTAMLATMFFGHYHDYNHKVGGGYHRDGDIAEGNHDTCPKRGAVSLTTKDMTRERACSQDASMCHNIRAIQGQTTRHNSVESDVHYSRDEHQDGYFNHKSEADYLETGFGGVMLREKVLSSRIWS